MEQLALDSILMLQVPGELRTGAAGHWGPRITPKRVMWSLRDLCPSPGTSRSTAVPFLQGRMSQMSLLTSGKNYQQHEERLLLPVA